MVKRLRHHLMELGQIRSPRAIRYGIKRLTPWSQDRPPVWVQPVVFSGGCSGYVAGALDGFWPLRSRLLMRIVCGLTKRATLFATRPDMLQSVIPKRFVSQAGRLDLHWMPAITCRF